MELGVWKHSESPQGVLGAAPEANAFRAICSSKLAENDNAIVN